MNKKLCICTMAILLITGSFGFLYPVPNAVAFSLTAQDFSVQIVKLDFPILTQYYNGVLYGASETGDNRFLYSTDSGQTWNYISTLIGNPRQSAPFFIDSQGNFFLYITKNDTIIKSSDLGSTWTGVFDFRTDGRYTVDQAPSSRTQGFTEDNQGNLYFGVYGTGDDMAHIWKSANHGNTWGLIHDFNARHIHAIQFDPYNSALYAAVGDAANATMGNYRSTDNGNTWAKITHGNWKITSILSTQNYTYWGSDMPVQGQAFVARSNDDVNFTETYLLGSGLGVELVGSIAISPVTGVLYATAAGNGVGVKGIWASADEGETWTPIYTVNDLTGTSYDFEGISNYAGGYWFIQQIQSPSSTIRLKDLTKVEVMNLAFKLRERQAGQTYSATSPALTTFSQHLSFMQEPLRDAKLQFEGISFRQTVNNPSFEQGTLGQLPTYWRKVDYPGNNWSVAKSDTQSLFGNYSLGVQGNNATSSHGEVQQTYVSSISSGTSLMALYYVRVENVFSFEFNFEITVHFKDNSTSNEGYDIDNESTQGWIPVRFAYTTPKAVDYLIFRFQIGGEGKAWVDGVFVGLIQGDSVNLLRTLCWKNEFLNYNVLINTTNPTVKINGQSIAYNGQVENGTDTKEFGISGTLTGLETVEASSEGSSLFKVHIEGTKILDAYNVLFNKGDIFYGKSYSDDSAITNYDNEMYAYSDRNSTISSLSFGLNKLNLNVYAPYGAVSTTVIYVGNMSKPAKITPIEADGGYNERLKLQTLTSTHSGEQDIVLEWNLPASNTTATNATSTVPPKGTTPKYTLTINVKNGVIPVPNASVTVGSDSNETDSMGNLALTGLSPGTYSISVSVDGEIKYMSQIQISQNSTFQIDLADAGTKPTTPQITWSILAVAVGIAVIAVTVLIRKKH